LHRYSLVELQCVNTALLYDQIVYKHKTRCLCKVIDPLLMYHADVTTCVIRPSNFSMICNNSAAVQNMYISSCSYLTFICCIVCPEVNFRMVYMMSSTIPASLKDYATTDAKGEGLILLDAAAVAELCPMIRSADYM